MADEKPKEGVQTENDHINLKAAGRMVLECSLRLRGIHHCKLMQAYCEGQGLSIRQIRFRFDEQPTSETDTPAQVEMGDEDTLLCSSSRQEVSTT